jgi:acyl dehydratase
LPIDLDKVVGAHLPVFDSSWDEQRVILYHLGLGAGDPPTSEVELAYTYEANLKVLPSFATIPPFQALAHVLGVDGFAVNPMLLLHGEHEIEIHRQIPTAGQVQTISQITGVYDKGKAALVVVESVSSDDQGPMFTNRASLFARGEGGFGGSEVGPEPRAPATRRSADVVLEQRSLPQLGLLYRLSGDLNPLHADPAFAALGGFERPILHGLCSFGIACKAVVDHALGGDTSRVLGYRARFGGVAFPGETLVISLWKDVDTIEVEVMAKERSKPVLTNAAVKVA